MGIFMSVDSELYSQSTIYMICYNLQLQVDFLPLLILWLQILHVFQVLNLVFVMLKCDNEPHYCIWNVEIG